LGCHRGRLGRVEYSTEKNGHKGSHIPLKIVQDNQSEKEGGGGKVSMEFRGEAPAAAIQGTQESASSRRRGGSVRGVGCLSSKGGFEDR